MSSGQVIKLSVWHCHFDFQSPYTHVSVEAQNKLAPIHIYLHKLWHWFSSLLLGTILRYDRGLPDLYNGYGLTKASESGHQSDIDLQTKFVAVVVTMVSRFRTRSGLRFIYLDLWSPIVKNFAFVKVVFQRGMQRVRGFFEAAADACVEDHGSQCP